MWTVVWAASSIIMWTINKEYVCISDMKDESYSNVYGLHFLWSQLSSLFSWNTKSSQFYDGYKQYSVQFPCNQFQLPHSSELVMNSLLGCAQPVTAYSFFLFMY